MTDNDYSDIIALPHPVSKRHAQMSMDARAAQFAPFAALSGYEDAIQDAAKLPYEEKITREMQYDNIDPDNEIG